MFLCDIVTYITHTIHAYSQINLSIMYSCCITCSCHLYTGVKEHYFPQNNIAENNIIPAVGAGIYRYVTASPEQNYIPINPIVNGD